MILTLGYHFALRAHTLCAEKFNRFAMRYSDNSRNSPSAPPRRKGLDAPERRRRLIYQTVEHLRDHAVFDVPDPQGNRQSDEQSEGASAAPLAPHGPRTRMGTGKPALAHNIASPSSRRVSMVSLPFFWLIFSYFAPAATWHIGPHSPADVCVLWRAQHGQRGAFTSWCICAALPSAPTSFTG